MDVEAEPQLTQEEGASIPTGDEESAIERPAPSRRLASAESPDSSVARIVADLRAGDSPGQTLLATFIAWSTTVAPAALSRSAVRPAALIAVLALVCGLVGPILRPSRPTLSRHLGITAFLALATGAWLLGSPAIQPARLDPLRAAVGAVAWGAYALSWRERWDHATRKPEAKPDLDAPVLQARSTLPLGARLIVTLGILGSLVFLVLAWNVRDADRALAAQAVAVACAVGVSTVAASVAVERGRRSSRSSRRLSPQAARAFLMLVLFGVLGVVAFVLRG